MKLPEPPKLDEASRAVEGVTRDDVQARVRRFASLRAAHRALTPSSREEASDADLEALRSIREQLRGLVERFESPGAADDEPRASATGHDDLVSLDGSLDGYARLLLAKLEQISLPQLRASLTGGSDAERVEIAALLELCMQSETTPSRHLAVVDLLVTLLAARKRDGVWFVETDPPNLNEAVRERCWEAGSCEPGAEAMIVKRFQHAAERLSQADEAGPILAEISAYKNEIAGFFFVPSVLRCIVGYNVVARNHFEARVRRSREADSAFDEELGDFEGRGASLEAGPGGSEAPLLPPDECPGILAVQEAVQRRVLRADAVSGPASRLAERLDLSWLGEPERQAFAAGGGDPLARTVRLTVVLGHLAMVFPESRADCSALGLHESQLDAWICSIGEEVQSRINELIRSDYAGALQLGETKSRFLQAVLLLARRRSDPARQRWSGSGEPDTFRRDALAFVREYLERERLKQQKLFVDLMGGGWRRTAALAAVLMLVAWVGFLHVKPAGPRGIQNFSARQARDVSPFLESAYRDHARQGSMFVAVVGEAWNELDANGRRTAAEKIRGRMGDEGVDEILLYDADRVLVAHFKQGAWRNQRAWTP